MSAASGYATLCNFENSLQCRTLTAMQQAQRDLFVHYAPKNPDILWVNVDCTPIYVYGNHEYKEFSGHYGDYCLMATVIFINNFPVYVTLDRGCQDEHAMLEEVCEETIDFLREHYPGAPIVFRVDSGFARVHQVTRQEKPQTVLRLHSVIGVQKRVEELASYAFWCAVSEAHAGSRLWKALYYVACTRAVDVLFLSCGGIPGAFIRDKSA